MVLRFFLCGLAIALSAGAALAEDVQQPAVNNQLYSRSSKLSVDNINKATTVLRDPVAAIKNTGETKQPPLKDPTKINQNFLQALKHSRGKGTASQTDQQSVNFPTIRLLGKVYHPKTAREILKQNKPLNTDEQSSIVLQIDGDVVHLHEGDSSSVIKNNQLYTIEVEEITPYSVTLILQPAQETLVLH